MSPFPQARKEIEFCSLQIGTAFAVPESRWTKSCFPANGAALTSVRWRKDDFWGSVPWSAMSTGRAGNDLELLTIVYSWRGKRPVSSGLFNGGCNLIKLLLISTASLFISIMGSGIREPSL